MRIIGDDYSSKAFEFAHEADPAAELYYNDYTLENAPKRDGAVRLVANAAGRGSPVTAIGLQGHEDDDGRPSRSRTRRIRALAALGVKVNITELDIDRAARRRREPRRTFRVRAAAAPNLDPYTAGLPDSVQRALAQRYADLFRVFLQAPGRDRSRYFLGRGRRRFVAQRLARSRTHELSAVVRSSSKPKPAYQG